MVSAGLGVTVCLPTAALVTRLAALRNPALGQYVAEHIAFLGRHPGFRDPQVSPALQLVDGSLQPKPTHYGHAARAGRAARRGRQPWPH